MADPKHPRKSGEELKRQIAQPYDNGKGPADTKAEYDIGHSTPHRWVRAIHENGSTKAADNRTPEQQGPSIPRRRTSGSRWRSTF